MATEKGKVKSVTKERVLFPLMPEEELAEERV